VVGGFGGCPPLSNTPWLETFSPFPHFCYPCVFRTIFFSLPVVLYLKRVSCFRGHEVGADPFPLFFFPPVIFSLFSRCPLFSLAPPFFLCEGVIGVFCVFFYCDLIFGSPQRGLRYLYWCYFPFSPLVSRSPQVLFPSPLALSLILFSPLFAKQKSSTPLESLCMGLFFFFSSYVENSFAFCLLT